LESHFQPKFVSLLGAALQKYTTGKDFKDFATSTEVQINQLGEKLAQMTSEMVTTSARFAEKTETLRGAMIDNKEFHSRELNDHVYQTRKWVE